MPAEAVSHPRLAVIGTGLIGGSLARAVRRSGWAGHITGCGLDAGELERAAALGVVDDHTLDVAEAARRADVIVVATDLEAMCEIFGVLAATAGPEAVITDVGSVKNDVIRQARNAFGAALPRFVPGHPIAGTERSGVEASFAGLFDDHLVVLTPLPETTPTAVAAVTRMWEAAGATVTTLAPEEHDELLAVTSHLPHLIAYAMVYALRHGDFASARREDALKFAAGGFSDLTRIAQSRPELWVDIIKRNRDAVLRHGRGYATVIDQFLAALEQNDYGRLLEVFAEASETRSRLPARRRPRD